MAAEFDQPLPQPPEVQLNLRVDLALPVQAQLDRLIRQLSQLERSGKFMVGANEFHARTPNGAWVHTNNSVAVTPGSHLHYARTEESAELEPGDFVVSPRLGRCQAVYYTTSDGWMYFHHNQAWNHFDIPGILATQFAGYSQIRSGAVICGFVVLSRHLEDIAIIAKSVSKILRLTPEQCQAALLPSDAATFPCRIWGHVDHQGCFAYQATTDKLPYKPIPIALQPALMLLEQAGT